MSDAFISYRRVPSSSLALLIQTRLETIHKLDVYVDVTRQDSNGIQFPERLLQAIDRSRCFVCLLSDTTLDSDWVQREIQYAYEQKKFCIPVFQENYKKPIHTTPSVDYLLNHDGVRLYELSNDYVYEGITKIVHLINGASAKHNPILPFSREVIEASYPSLEAKLALRRAENFTNEGSKNQDWTPFTTYFGELKIPYIPFCLVPTGKFMMGGDHFMDRAESPSHLQVLKEPFYISKYPVTNEMWRVAAEIGIVDEPKNNIRWFSNKRNLKSPIVGIDWFQANKFARWVGCRLPTEVEWEYAARGVDGWLYPWGSDWNKRRNTKNFSWVGACNMSGDIWEWTSSIYTNYPYISETSEDVQKDNVRRVLRGGSPDSSKYYSQSIRRNIAFPETKNNSFGFRLALRAPLQRKVL
jgi:hypothetical protein